MQGPDDRKVTIRKVQDTLYISDIPAGLWVGVHEDEGHIDCYFYLQTCEDPQRLQTIFRHHLEERQHNRSHMLRSFINGGTLLSQQAGRKKTRESAESQRAVESDNEPEQINAELQSEQDQATLQPSRDFLTTPDTRYDAPNSCDRDFSIRFLRKRSPRLPNGHGPRPSAPPLRLSLALRLP